MIETLSKLKLKNVCKIEKGKIGITKAIKGEYPLIVTAEERLSHNEWHFDEHATIVPLVSSTGHGHASIKRLHYAEGKYAVGNILATLIPKDPNYLNAKYLYVYLTLNKEELLVSQMTGAANVTLTLNRLAEVEIVIPDYETQLRFIKQYENSKRFKSNMHSHIENRSELVEKLKIQILQDAILGKLSEKWRKENPNVETASVLLEKIKKEKQELIKQGKIKKQKNHIVSIPYNEAPFELPKSWLFTHMNEFSDIGGGKRLPSGHLFSDLPTPNVYIRVKDFKDNSISSDDLVYISDKTKERIENYVIKKNELYVTIAGTTGYVGKVPEFFDGMNLTENACKILPIGVDKDWLMYTMMSKYVQDFWNKIRFKAAQPKLALFKIRETVIPLPPLAEQRFIAMRIESLFTKLDKIKNLNTLCNNDIDLLQQIVLKEMFVP